MSTGMPWVKLYAEIIDDPKIGRLADAQKWRYISLVVLAGEYDAEGALVDGSTPLTPTDLAWRLRISAEVMCADLEILTSAGLLEHDDATGTIWVSGFADRQGRTQDEKRQMWREQKRAQRGNGTGEPEPPELSAEGPEGQPELSGECPHGHREESGESPRVVQSLEKDLDLDSEGEKETADAANASESPPTIEQLLLDLPDVLLDLEKPPDDGSKRNPVAILLDWIEHAFAQEVRGKHARIGSLLNLYKSGPKSARKWTIPQQDVYRLVAQGVIAARRGKPEGDPVAYIQGVLKRQKDEQSGDQFDEASWEREPAEQAGPTGWEE